MTISLTCTCGNAFPVASSLAGRRVKCPACQAVVAVPPRPGLRPDEYDGEAPRLRRKQGKKSNTLLLVGGGVGGVFLLGLCCAGGVGAWFKMAS